MCWNFGAPFPSRREFHETAGGVKILASRLDGRRQDLKWGARGKADRARRPPRRGRPRSARCRAICKPISKQERAMKLTSAQVERTLTQFEAQAIPDHHPVVPQLKNLFGEHTFFLDDSGLNIVEPAGSDRSATD